MGRLFERRRETQLLHRRGIVNAVLDAYDIEPERTRLLRYEDNAVYAVDAGGKRYSLRLSVRDGRTVAEQESELAWLAAIARNGRMRAPMPVPTVAGAPLATLSAPLLDEPVTAVLLHWIHGQADPAYMSTTAVELGRVTARLHDEGEAFHRSNVVIRPSWGVRDLFDDGAVLNDPRAPDMIGHGGVRTVGTAGERLARVLPASGEGWGLIHADLHAENLVLTEDREVAVIDFDDCGFGWHMLDMATVLSSMVLR